MAYINKLSRYLCFVQCVGGGGGTTVGVNPTENNNDEPETVFSSVSDEQQDHFEYSSETPAITEEQPDPVVPGESNETPELTDEQPAESFQIDYNNPYLNGSIPKNVNPKRDYMLSNSLKYELRNELRKVFKLIGEIVNQVLNEFFKEEGI